MSSVIEFNNDPYDYDENNNEYYPCPFVNTPKFDKENIQFCKFFFMGRCFMDEYDSCRHKSDS